MIYGWFTDYYAVRAVVGRGTETVMVHQTSEINLNLKIIIILIINKRTVLGLTRQTISQST